MSKKSDGALSVPEQEMVELALLNPAPYNPRVMPAGMMRSLKASLAKHGMVLNLVVQRRGMTIIGGHQRLAAMRELCAERGWPEPARVPAVVLDIGDSAAKQLNVSLNNVEGEFDAHKLGELFASVRDEMTDDDVLATGFGRDNIDELLRQVLDPGAMADLLEEEASQLPAFATSVTLTLEFATVAERDEVKDELKARARAEGRKPGALVLEALRAARGREKALKAKADGKKK